MKTVKAVVTAAGRSQRHLPLQPVVDHNGYPRSACRVFADELASAGIEAIALIICPGDEPLYRDALEGCRTEIHFIEQEEPLGYGHAVLCARDFVGGDPFLLTVGDHIYLSDDAQASCARQLVDLARTQQSAVSAVQATHESKLPYFGAIGGAPLSAQPHAITIERVLEKPTPTDAEQQLLVPGLRPGYYYCFFGMHVLPASLMAILQAQLDALPPGQPLQLSPALQELARHGDYLAAELRGRRYDLGQPFGLLIAQMAVALESDEREAVLAQLVELLAQIRN